MPETSDKFHLKFFNHSLFRNTLRIFSGNVVIQIISFFTLPVFARIYSPEDYGIWGIFVFMAGLISIIASFRYELSIMIPKSDLEAGILMKISKTIGLVFCIFSFLLLLITGKYIFEFFNLKYNIYFLLLIPFHAWLTNYNNILLQWISRKSRFRLLMYVRLVQSIINIIITFCLGYFLNLGEWGLIIALVCSQLISNILIQIRTGIPLATSFIFNSEKCILYIKKYNNFIRYSTPLGILNYFSGNILTTVIQISYGSYFLGLYNNAIRVVHTPIQLISSSFSPVFYQYFSRSKSRLRLIISSFAGLAILNTLLILPLALWGEEIFTFYLGERWAPSAEFIRLLYVVTVMSFSVGSISSIFSFLQKENLVLVWQIIYLAVICTVLYFMGDDYRKGILYYSWTGGIAYFVLFWIAVYLIRKNKRDAD